MRRCNRLVTAVALLVSGVLPASLVASTAGRQTPGVRDTCESWVSRSAAGDLAAPHGDRVQMRIRRAVTLFRFGRTQDAFRKLDAAVEMVTQIVDSRVSREQRTKAITEIQTLQACLEKTKPPALATIIVRPLHPLDDEGEKLDDRPIAGAYVRVEGLHVGDTGRNGTLRVRVPSGPITVEALSPPSSGGGRQVTLAPGTTTTVSFPFFGDAESISAEDSVMTLTEAVDGIVPAGTRSLTLRFVSDDGSVQIVSVQRIALLNVDADEVGDLIDAFDFEPGGGLVAHDVPTLMKALARDGNNVTLRVDAGDASGFSHSGSITFRVR